MAPFFTWILPMLLLFALSVGSFLRIKEANFDFSDGRYLLWMDELISYDEIQKILHPENFQGLMKAIAGNDHRYGRATFYLPAIASVFAEKIGGEKATIISIRLFDQAVLWGAYLLFVFLLLRGAWIRFFSFLMLLLLPSTVYFSTLPRPEPFLLASLALTLFAFSKNNFRLAFLFLGFSLGMKISALPLALAACLLFLLKKTDKTSFKSQMKDPLQKFCFLFLGMALAVPILFTGNFSDYLRDTIHNTAHGADDNSVNAITWIRTIRASFFPNQLWGTGLLLSISIWMLWQIFDLIRVTEIKKLFQRNDLFQSRFLLALGTGAFLFPTLIFVKRVWEFYLHPGFVLLIVWIAVDIEYRRLLGKKRESYLSTALFILLLANGIFMSGKLQKELTGLETRSQSPEHLLQMQTMNYNLEILKTVAGDEVNPKLIYFDPALYMPTAPSGIRFDRFWGPFTQWEKRADVIFTYKARPPEPEADISKVTSAEKDSTSRALDLRQQHVKSSNGCSLLPCYEIIGETEISRAYKLVSPH